MVVIAETEDDLIKRLNEWKNNVENRGMRVNMNETKVMISGERQKLMEKAARWPCGVCSRGVGSNSVQLMPLPLTFCCSSKSVLVLPFWYRLTRVVPEKVPLNGC